MPPRKPVTRHRYRAAASKGATVPAQAPVHFLDGDRGRVLLLIAILAIAAFLRFYRLSDAPPGLHCDEAMNGNLAAQVLETHHLQVFYRENNGTEGLFVNLLTVPLYIFGNTPFALRIVSATFGFLTVWGLYFLGKELMSAAAGLLAAFFAATNFVHMDLSRIATRGIMPPCLLAWSLALYFTGMRRLRGGKPYLATMLAAGALYGIGFHTYIPYRVTPVLIAALLVHYRFCAATEQWRAQFWKAAGAFVATAIVAVLPLLVFFVRNPAELTGRTSQVSVFNAPRPALELMSNVWKTAGMFFIAGDANWRHNYDRRPELYWPVAIFFAAGIAVAVMEWRARARFLPHAFLVLFLVLGAIPELLSAEGVPHAFRAILMLPPVFLLAADGALTCYRLSGRIRWPIRNALAACVLLLLIYQPFHTYFELWATRTEVTDAFQQSMVQVSYLMNESPVTIPKLVGYAVPNPPAANGIPIDLQTVAFITRSYTEKQRSETNFRYLTLAEIQQMVGSKATGSELCDETARIRWPGKMACWGFEPFAANGEPNHPHP